MSASLLSQLEMLSHYNRLANEQVFNACGRLPEEELTRPRKAFFGSILATLNHILLVDRLWLDRFTGTDCEPAALDEILYADFEELRAARVAEDARMEEFIENLRIAFLSSRFQYKDHLGQYRQDSADLLVLHMFNHQTHHRGQLHVMLTQTGIEEPNLDLHRLIHP